MPPPTKDTDRYLCQRNSLFVIQDLVALFQNAVYQTDKNISIFLSPHSPLPSSTPSPLKKVLSIAFSFAAGQFDLLSVPSQYSVQWSPSGKGNIEGYGKSDGEQFHQSAGWSDGKLGELRKYPTTVIVMSIFRPSKCPKSYTSRIVGKNMFIVNCVKIYKIYKYRDNLIEIF